MNDPDIQSVDPGSPAPTSFRSPRLMGVENSALIVIDVQERLLPVIKNHQRLTANLVKLIRGAGILGVSVHATEQYPRGLGTTSQPIRSALDSIGVEERPEKLMFSCRQCRTVSDELMTNGIRNLLLTGIETHVCVAQSALDFIAAGYNVLVAVDAVGSRFEIDHQTALSRLEGEGVVPTTTEAALFEWCEVAGSERFKQISALVRERTE